MDNETMQAEAMIPATPRMAEVSPEYAEIMMLGNVLHKSGYFKDLRDQAQAVTKILFGRELGFSPIIAISGIHIIEGKPSLSSNLMATLIKRSGLYDYRVKTWTDTECALMFRQRESRASAWEEVGLSTFTMADAQRAGVVRSGGGWAKYPKAMLFARALSQGLRTYCPDVSASPIYCPEEMGAEVNEEGDVVQLPKSARPVEVTTQAIPISGPGKGSPVSEVKGAPEIKAADVFSPREPGDEAPEEEISARRGPIDLAHQRAIHRAFRDAIRNEGAKKGADAFLQDWLKRQGFVDGNDKGTTKTIHFDQFEATKNAAVAFAAGLPL